MPDLVQLAIEIVTNADKAAADLKKLTDEAKNLGKTVAGEVKESVTKLKEDLNTGATATGNFAKQLISMAANSTFLSKAISEVTKGITHAAFTAIGTAAGIMWSKIADKAAITTFEEALKEQDRLLKEVKTQIDARTSAEAKFNAQPPNVTRFQNLQNEIDLTKKLTEMSDKLQSKVTTPSNLGMPEMGIAPDVSTMAAPGYEKVRGAVENLVESIKNGKPEVTAFVDELARIAIANPELKSVTEEIIKMGGPALEQAVFKARALEDALKGVATAAQLAALGYASIAQFQVGNRMETEKAAAMERQALATKEIAAMYPGLTLEGAKQVYALEQQLTVAQARGGAERIVAQEAAAVNIAWSQGKPMADALAAAATQRAIAEERAKAAIDNQIKGLDQQYELMRATSDEEKARVKAAQAYAEAFEETKDSMKASQLAAAVLRNETEKIAQNEERATEAAADRHDAAAVAQVQRWNDEVKKLLAQEADLAHLWERVAGAMASINWETMSVVLDRLGNVKTWNNNGQMVQFNPEGYTSSAAGSEFIGQSLQQRREFYGSGNYTESATGPFGTIEIKPTKEWWDATFKVTDALTDLTGSTNSLNATMQGMLSPYYSQDPRTTKLGFRAGTIANPDWMMSGASNDNPVGAVTGWSGGSGIPGYASGGEFTVPGGYSSNDNKLVQFRARSGEKVSIGTPESGRAISIDNRVIINGNVDQDVMAKFKRTQFQQGQRMRGMLAAG